MYSAAELKQARSIYHNLIQADLEAGVVTSDMLMLSLNPLKTKRLYGNRNYSEVEDEEIEGKDQAKAQKKLEPSVTETSHEIGAGGQKKLLKGLAVYKAVSEGNQEIENEIR